VTGGQAAALAAEFRAGQARTPGSLPANSGPEMSGSVASVSNAPELRLPFERLPGRCGGQRSAPGTISRFLWMSRGRASTGSIPAAGLVPGGSDRLEDRFDEPARLGPPRVLSRYAATARQASAGPACDDCRGDLPSGDATTDAKAGEWS
jgi:hypothetical protein